LAVYVLLLQNTTMTEQNVRVSILESGGLTELKQLIMYKAVLNSVQLLYVIYDSPTCFATKFCTKSISTNRHSNTNETFRTERSEQNVVTEVSQGGGCLQDGLRHIKSSLGRDSLGEDGGLRDVELQASIFLEDGLELRQDLEGHTRSALDVPIICICYRPSLLELT
jgi:hypothetical protein